MDMKEEFKITEATRRTLDAMAELDIDTIYDVESGDFIFTYKTMEMVVLATKEEGGVCLSAEFVMDRYMDTIAELWLEVPITMGRDLHYMRLIPEWVAFQGSG